MISFLRWVLRLVALVVFVVLVGRTLVEYAPGLMTIPLIAKTVAHWDPVLQRLVERVGLSWSRNVRALGLPAAVVALVVLRIVLDDLLLRLEGPRKPKSGAPVPAPAKPPAPAGTTPDGTVLNPAMPGAKAQSPTGTAVLPAYQPPAPAGPPTRIGRYEIVGELGHGAMGTVYKARDPKIGRTVAIKTISALGTSPDIGEYRERFLMEAKSAGRLSHPGVVAVYDVTDDSLGRPCLVLEFVEGTTLDKLTAEKRLPLAVALDYVSQIARALGYAHSQGIIHRDVKPSNIMVTKSGQAKLSDFGIAKIEGTTLTVAGQVLGTPAFMSPEQCRGDTIDHRSDIFSLGAVLYLLATNVRPFPGRTFTSVAYQVVHNEPVPVSRADPGLPPELEPIVAKCLAKAAADRYASSALVANDLDALRARLAAQGSATAT